MPNVSVQDNFFIAGDILNHYILVKSGQMAIAISIEYQGKTTAVYCAILEPGEIQGLEFIFNNNHSAEYSLLALKSSEIETLKTNGMVLYKKTPEELMGLFIQYKPTVENILKTQSIIDGVFSTAHRIFYSFISVLSYISKKYNFTLTNKDIIAEIEKANNYIQSHDLESKLFPLTDELYTISFNELNPFNENGDFIHSFYLKRMLQLIPYLQNGIGKDKVFMLNLLLETGNKVESIIVSIKNKMQQAAALLQLFFSENILKVIKDFLQQAERSEDISRYLFFTMKSSVIFFEQKSIQPLEQINYELFLALKDSLEPYKDLISKTEYSMQPNNGSGDLKEAIPNEFQGSLNQILDYSELDLELRTKFLEEYNKWKMSPKRMSVDDDINKMRKRIAEYFWQIYVAAFKQHKLHNKTLIKPVELFFKYGFIDETLISINILKALIERSVESYKEAELRIYNTYDWLIAVCDEDIPPSNSSTGEYMDVMLREMAREEEYKTGKKVEPKSFNTLEFRIEYEINNLVRESVKVCNGVFNTYIPILLEEQFPMLDLNQQFLSQEKVTRTFMELRKLDFSAFYREVRYKEGNIEEFIQKEVLPIFIFMPGVGTRSIVWQPKDRLKDTPARIALPFLSFTKPMQSMIYSFGFYRWEIVKDILGPSWNDISLMSLTSEYSDYESSYKSSKDLDEDAREKITQEFKKYRNTRERFIHDYGRWITVDSQGRPGVNKVVRELMYRQVPFPKAIREKLGKMPAYEQFNDRYNILMRKEVSRLKLRYQKYQREDGTIPPELTAYLQFLIK